MVILQQRQQQQQQMMLQGQGQPGMMGVVQQGMPPQGPPGNMPAMSQPQQQSLFMDDFDLMWGRADAMEFMCWNVIIKSASHSKPMTN